MEISRERKTPKRTRPIQYIFLSMLHTGKRRRKKVNRVSKNVSKFNIAQHGTRKNANSL